MLKATEGTVGIVCSKYPATSTLFLAQSRTDLPDKTICLLRANNLILLRDDSCADATALVSALANVKAQVLAATPTTSQGTPFPENVDIDDYGMMYWLDEDDELVGIPQGAKFFYPVNYKGFTDDLCNRTGGDAGNVVIQNEKSQLKEAIGGTLRQLLAVKESVDFANTDVKDMADLAWVYQSAYNLFYSDSLASVIKRPSSISAAANILSTRFSTKPQEQVTSVGLDVGVTAGEGRLYVSNPQGITNENDFKAYVKGVLLAYEKA